MQAENKDGDSLTQQLLTQGFEQRNLFKLNMVIQQRQT